MDTLITVPVRFIKGSIILRIILSQYGIFELIIAWHVISRKGTANQSWLNTFPSTHMKVTLNPTGGAGVKSKNA